jgi:RNA polymerase subunit RPABC4/transcription elongation factor Spt4
MSIDQSVGMQDKGSIKYCVECGAKVPRSQRICPACGESQN